MDIRLLLVIGLFAMCECVVYELAATPNKVILGRNLIISARLFNLGIPHGDVKINLARPGEQAVNIFDNLVAGCRFVVEPYISTGTIDQCDNTNHRYTITFPSVTADHIGSYGIEAPFQTPPMMSAGGGGTVQVLVKPTSVVVSPASTEVVAGQYTRLTCTVDNDADIPVTFVWKKIQNENRFNPPLGSTATNQFDQRSNKLEWTSVGSQDGGQYECQAGNEAGSVTNTTATFQVYYAADSVILTASSTTVNAGSSVSVTCSSSGGNPRPGLVIYDVTSITVLKELPQSSGAATLIFTKLTQKSDDGAQYACKTKVNVAVGTIPVKTSNTITLIVQFRPNGIRTPPTIDVDEGQWTSIPCETTSSSNPETTLAWSGPAIRASIIASVSEDFGIISTNSMTVTGDRTRSRATYTCTATHLGQQLFMATTTVNSNFAPNGIALSDTADTPISESQSRVMKCVSETSRPAGIITWSKLIGGKEYVVSAEALRQVPGDYGGIVLESQININATRQDNGAEYWCEVDYTYSNGTKVFRKSSTRVLDVHYSVDVSISTSPGSDIQEGNPVNLICDTNSGNPKTIDKYSWSYNNQNIQEAAGRILSLDPIRYDQGGRYSCSATNKAGTSSAQVNIDVKYKPILDPNVPQQLELFGDLEDNVTLSLTVLSNPSPSGVQWSRNSTTLGQRFTSSSDGLTYTLKISDVVKVDYGHYTCRITNSVGSTNFTFILKTRGPPETPTEFRITGTTMTSLTVQWRSGISGATNQTFLLEMKDLTGKRVLEVENSGSGRLVNYKITNLTSDTEYQLRVKSRNDAQLYSSFTSFIITRTKSDQIDASPSYTVIILVVLLLLLLLLVMLVLTAVVTVKYRRAMNALRKIKQESLYENPAFVNDTFQGNENPYHLPADSNENPYHLPTDSSENPYHLPADSNENPYHLPKESPRNINWNLETMVSSNHETAHYDYVTGDLHAVVGEPNEERILTDDNLTQKSRAVLTKVPVPSVPDVPTSPVPERTVPVFETPYVDMNQVTNKIKEIIRRMSEDKVENEEESVDSENFSEQRNHVDDYVEMRRSEGDSQI